MPIDMMPMQYASNPAPRGLVNPELPPDPLVQANALATGNSQRQLMAQQTQDLATDNQVKQAAFQSQQNLMKWIGDPKNDIHAAISTANASGKPLVIPGVMLADAMAVQQHYQQIQQQGQSLTEGNIKIGQDQANILRGQYSNVHSQADLTDANAKALAAGVPQSQLLGAYPGDDTHWKAMVGTIGMASDAAAYARTQAETVKAQGEADLAAQNAGDKRRTSAGQEFEAALGPGGVIDDPDKLTALKSKYPDIPFPTTAAGSKQFLLSQVPVNEQPKFKMANMEFEAASSITPQSIQQRADLMFNPANYSDPNIKAQVQREHDTAVQAAMAATPLGTAAVNKAFTDSSDRIGRLTAGVAQANATVGAKVQVIAGGEAAKNAQSGLTPEAVDMLADSYRKTGQMPAMGMRNAYAMRQVIDAAAAKGPLDIASEGAAFKANQASLTGLVKQRDSVSAFENTAGKNLDLLLSQAPKVLDTGSPWLNAPLRSLSANLVGDANVPAYNAARQVAINEVAKVTSNPGLTGQLSDSARHEVESFNPSNATFAQTVHVAQVLRQDMANRHQAYNEQISDITRRIGTGGSVQDQTGVGQNPNPSGGSGQYTNIMQNGAGHQIGIGADRKWHDVKTGALIQ